MKRNIYNWISYINNKPQLPNMINHNFQGKGLDKKQPTEH